MSIERDLERNIVRDQVWVGRGEASDQKLRVIRYESEESIIVERIAGADPALLRRPFRITGWQLRAAFACTPERAHAPVG